MKKIFATAAVFSMMVAAFVGVAAAQSNTEPDTMFSCVDGNGKLKKTFLNVEPTCKQNETLYAWNVGEGVPPQLGGQSPTEAHIALKPFSTNGQGCPGGWAFIWSCGASYDTEGSMAVKIDGARYPAGTTFVLSTTTTANESGCYRLFDLTDGAAVADSTMCGAEDRIPNVYVALDSAPFSLPNAEHEYVVQASGGGSWSYLTLRATW